MKHATKPVEMMIAAGALAYLATRPPVARQLWRGMRFTACGLETAFSALAQWKFIMNIVAPPEAAPTRLIAGPVRKLARRGKPG
jgi:hypothetical protein